MPYTLSTLIQLGPDHAGLTGHVTPHMFDMNGIPVAMATPGLFFELGDQGDYGWTWDGFQDGFRGYVVFASEATGEYLTAMAINPQEFENVVVPDVQIPTGATVRVIAPVTPSGQVRIFAGDDYNESDSRSLDFIDDGGTWPAVSIDDPVKFGAGFGDRELFVADGRISAIDPKKVSITIAGSLTLDVQPAKNYTYQLRLARVGHTITIASGRLIVEPRYG